MTRWEGLRAAALMLVVAVVALAAPTPDVVAAPSIGRAAVGSGDLTVRISEFEPAIPQPDDVLTVNGTVTNVSDDTVGSVSVVLRRSPTPLVNRAEITEVLAGEGQRTGLPVPGVLAPLDDLPPGGSQPFQLSVDVADLDLSTSGVYVIGAEAIGDAGSGAIRQDIDRTFLPWWQDDTVGEPLLLTIVWPLTGAPVADARGVLLSEDPAVSMSPAGRLSRLLDAAAGNPGAVTIALDPEVVLTAAALADGYRVRPPAGEVEPGTRSREVADWLDRLRAALAEPRAQATGSLYAWPDVDAVRRAKLLSTVMAQQPQLNDRATAISGTEVTGTLVLPPSGVAQARTLAALTRERAGAVLLSDRALALAAPTFFTPSGNVVVPTAQGELPGLLADTRLAETLAMPMDSAPEQLAVRQALLAQTLVTERELPSTRRLLVAAVDPEWNPPSGAADMVISALADAPWVSPTPVARALQREPSTLPRVWVEPTPDEAAQELPGSHLATVTDQFGVLREYSTVVPDPELVPEITRTAPTRLLGSWFRSHPDQRSELTGRVTAQVDSLVASVRVLSSGSITVSGTSGAIPITVENEGPNPVSVGLVLESTPSQLVSAEPIAPFTVEPGRRTSVVVTAQVAAGGPIPVNAQLVTSTGEHFGEPGRLVVESSAYANAARVLVRVALATLVVTVAVHGLRRARRRRRAAAAAAGIHPSTRSGDSS